ncbi:MAG: helix-turn-helix domain-containing protein [Methanobacteriota archaeon]
MNKSEESTNIKTTLAEKIAGEITLSPKPGKTIRKWREIFQISQTQLAQYLKVTPSVISDYESGRRKSPGIHVIKKIIEALVQIDVETNDSQILLRYQSFAKKNEGIIDIIEYPFGISIKDFIKEIEGTLITSPKKSDLEKSVNGFTLVDSIKVITTLNATNYTHLYGWSTDRALIFTGVRYGRSPMIAIRIHPVKPTVVVYHKPNEIDPLAIKLAEREKIPLVITMISLPQLRKKLITLGSEHHAGSNGTV